MNPPALILGGAENAVSVARSLSASGVTVHAIGKHSSPVRYSRHCASFVDLGHDGAVQDRWLEWLEHGPPGAVLLPCDDDGVELIARHRSVLEGRDFRVFEAADDVMLDMLDKSKTYDIARRIGVPSPFTTTVRTEQDLAAVIDDVRYPCALKPVHAHLFRRQLGTHLKAVTAANREELESTALDLVRQGLEMLLTEIIPGAEDQFAGYYSFIDEEGEPLFHFTKQKIRQNPPVFGDGTYHVTTWDPSVAEIGLKFFQGVGIRGMANVEFKRDAMDGSWKLIECNYRFTAINELLRLAGIDLALFAYNRLAGLPTPAMDRYRTGVRIWQPLADARASVALRARGDLSVAGWARSLAHRKHVPIFSLKDPGPTAGRTFWRLRDVYDKHSSRATS